MTALPHPADRTAPRSAPAGAVDRRSLLVAAAAAGAVVLLGLGGWVEAPGPSAGEVTADGVRAYFTENASALRVLTVSTAAAAAAWLVLSAALARIARAVAPASSTGPLVLVTGTVLAVEQLLFAAVQAPSTVVDVDAVPDAVLSDWYSLLFVEEYLGDLVTFVRAVLLGAVAVLVLRTRTLPRWFGVLTAVLAGCCAVGGATFLLPVDLGARTVPAGFWFAGTIGTALWPLPLLVVLLLRARRAR